MDRLIKRVFFIKEVHLLVAQGPVESKLLVRLFTLAAIKSLYYDVDYMDSSYGIRDTVFHNLASGQLPAKVFKNLSLIVPSRIVFSLIKV